MSGTLSIRNRRRGIPVNARLLRRVVSGLLRDCFEYRDFDLAIHLVGAAEITRLNETFLKHKGSTDVITFDYRFGVPRLRGRRAARLTDRLKAELQTLHGEIVICLDEAISQARRFRTTWQSELVRYAVHGILHLRGHDDSKPAARRRMKREENRLMKELGRRFSLTGLRKVSRV